MRHSRRDGSERECTRPRHGRWRDGLGVGDVVRARRPSDDPEGPEVRGRTERVDAHRIALGRKNYLFVHDSDAGASIAGLYSLVATCEARRINPFEYLADVRRPRARAGSRRGRDRRAAAAPGLRLATTGDTAGLPTSRRRQPESVPTPPAFKKARLYSGVSIRGHARTAFLKASAGAYSWASM